MSKIEKKLLENRSRGQKSIMIYLNSGDPCIETTEALIDQCIELGVDLIELGVPFNNSCSDGQAVRDSHRRALENDVELEQVFLLVERVRKKTKIPIVLLVDFSHTVKPRSLNSVVEHCRASEVDGLLIHGLPPLYLEDYLEATIKHGITPIFSLYPGSSQATIRKVLDISQGFIYLVSQYGKTGGVVNFESKELVDFYKNIRQLTKLPLLAGFGIKSPGDLKALFGSSSVDGAILGSALCKIISDPQTSQLSMLQATGTYLESMLQQKAFAYS